MLLCFTLNDTEEEKRKFVCLYEKYEQTMYAVAEKILKNPHAAEDAVQQAFLRIIDHLDQIEDVSSPKTKGFLVIITQHIAIDHYRKRKREQLDLYEELEVETPDSATEHLDENIIVQAILRLPFEDSAVLRLKYVHGYQTKEIAQMLQLKEATVRQRIFRAKKRLAKILEDEGVTI